MTILLLLLCLFYSIRVERVWGLGGAGGPGPDHTFSPGAQNFVLRHWYRGGCIKVNWQKNET